MELYSAIKKEWNLAICNNVDGAGKYNAKWSQSEKDKYHMISLMWSLRNKRTKKKRDKQKTRLLTLDNKLTVTREDAGNGIGETGDGDGE